MKAKMIGGDLLVTFKAKGSGITAEEFAPKLIGKYIDGSLAFGYARLPYVNYKPAILSARMPVAANGGAEIKVENFGLSSSEACDVALEINGERLGVVGLQALEPYGSVSLVLPASSFAPKEKDVVEVVFERNGKEIERNRFVKEYAKEKK